jgi:hypothetical protein
MNLPIQQARGIFTKGWLAKYRDMAIAPTFLTSLFNVRTYPTKTVGIEVQRSGEPIAVDVVRGSNGNRNTFSKSTEKEWMPPFFDEYFDLTALSAYDRMFGEGVEVVGAANAARFAQTTAEKLMMTTDKIKRAVEKMCADVLNTGVITLKDNSIIDFKRKSASMFDLGAAGYWGNTDADVEAQLIAGVEFMNNEGLNSASEHELIMSGAAWVALKRTNFFKNDANFNNVQLNDIKRPMTDSRGKSYHGQITAGAYTFNVWTYDKTYKDSTGSAIRYWPEDKVVILPSSGAIFELAYAGIATLDDNGMPVAREGQFVAYDYIDKKKATYTVGVRSAPLPIPVTVDLMYTMTAIGDTNPEVG